VSSVFSANKIVCLQSHTKSGVGRFFDCPWQKLRTLKTNHNYLLNLLLLVMITKHLLSEENKFFSFQIFILPPLGPAARGAAPRAPPWLSSCILNMEPSNKNGREQKGEKNKRIQLQQSHFWLQQWDRTSDTLTTKTDLPINSNLLLTRLSTSIYVHTVFDFILPQHLAS